MSAHLTINDGGKTQVIEYLSAISPNSDGTVFSQAFVIETVDLRDLSALVVTAY